MPSLTAFVACDTLTRVAGTTEPTPCLRPASHSWRIACTTPGHHWHPTCTGHVALIAAHINAHDGEWSCDQGHGPIPEPIITWRTL